MQRVYLGSTPDVHGRRRTGFTLIEILVVVAIIALLISIMLPSLRVARNQAKTIACSGNMHDLGTSLNVYSVENPPYFPPTPYVGSSMSGSSPPWGPADDNLFILWYRNYAKALEVFSCPATRFRIRRPDSIVRVPAINGWKYEITTAGQKDRSDFEQIAQKIPSAADQKKHAGFGASYEYNAWYQRGSDLPLVNWYWGKPANWVPDWGGDKLLTTRTLLFIPSRTFIMHDADESGNVINSNGGAINNVPEPWDNHGSRGMNVLFLDGHAEFFIKKNVPKVWNWKELPDYRQRR